MNNFVRPITCIPIRPDPERDIAKVSIPIKPKEIRIGVGAPRKIQLSFFGNFFLAKEARPISPLPNRSMVAGSGMVTKLPLNSVSAAIAIAAVNNSPPAIKKSVKRDLTILSFLRLICSI